MLDKLFELIHQHEGELFSRDAELAIALKNHLSDNLGPKFKSQEDINRTDNADSRNNGLKVALNKFFLKYSDIGSKSNYEISYLRNTVFLHKLTNIIIDSLDANAQKEIKKYAPLDSFSNKNIRDEQYSLVEYLKNELVDEREYFNSLHHELSQLIVDYKKLSPSLASEIETFLNDEDNFNTTDLSDQGIMEFAKLLHSKENHPDFFTRTPAILEALNKTLTKHLTTEQLQSIHDIQNRSKTSSLKVSSP